MVARFLVALFTGGLTLTCCALSASAQSSTVKSEAPSIEAGDCFERGLALVAAGNYSGALAEFERAYSLVPNAVVLYNIAAAYSHLGKSVEATAALERVLAAPVGLSEPDVARARRLLEAESRQIGGLVVTSNVPASIDIDEFRAATTPMAGSLRAAVGVHVVTASAPGFVPARAEVAIAAGATAKVALELVPTELSLAHLRIRSRLPGALVYVDGQRAGTTPLVQSLALVPGRHEVALRRIGYTLARSVVDLNEGSESALAFQLAEDPAHDASLRGVLSLGVSEPDAVVAVDGGAGAVYTQPLSLVMGPHHIEIDKAGFTRTTLDVDVPQGAEEHLRVELVPTPETRDRYVSHARTVRTAGWITASSGAALLATGIALVAVGQGQQDDAGRQRSSLAADPKCASNTIMASNCGARDQAWQSTWEHGQTMKTAGFIGGGVGLAAFGVGLYLLFTGEDPHRYDRLGTTIALWPSGRGLTWTSLF